MRRILPGLALLSLPLGLSAQVSVPAAAISAFVPPDHWSRSCLSLLEGSAAAPAGVEPGSGTLTRVEVARVLESADAVRDERAPGVAGCRSRLREEYATSTGARVAGSWWRRVEASVGGGWEDRRGAISTGVDESSGWSEPAALEDRSSGLVDIAAALNAGGRAAAAVALRSASGEVRVREAYVVSAIGPVGAWAGRRRVAYGAVRAGRLVLEAPEPLDGGGAFLARPVRLPVFGALRFETMVARLDRSGPVRRPWLWAMRAVVEPHARFELAVNRAAVFGGVGNGGFDAGDFAAMVAGHRRGDASRSDNQVASVEGVWFVPIHALRPVLRAEIGLDDGAGAWLDVPGLAIEAEARRIPGVPGLRLAAARTSFAPACCGHPPWYRHLGLPAGWSVNGVPLGHPLGGEGSEWRLRAWLAAADARLRVDASVFRRRRGGENLFAPDRATVSHGAAGWVRWRAGARLEVEAAGGRESGTGWTETRGRISVRWLF